MEPLLYDEHVNVTHIHLDCPDCGRPMRFEFMQALNWVVFRFICRVCPNTVVDIPTVESGAN